MNNETMVLFASQYTVTNANLVVYKGIKVLNDETLKLGEVKILKEVD